MNTQTMREYIQNAILEKFSQKTEKRTEALKEVLALALRDIDEPALDNFAKLVPEIPANIYQKWAEMFCDRLVKTVQKEQLAELCKESEENRATLALVYIMFMESERMEKVIAEDLKSLGITLSKPDDGATLLGAWLKARMTQTYQ